MAATGEALLTASLSDLQEAQGHLPTELGKNVKMLIDLLLKADPTYLLEVMFDDPGTATDLSEIAQDNGENVTALYKIYEQGDLPLPPEFSQGFILTLIRGLQAQFAEIYVRDQDLLPRLEYRILARVLGQSHKDVTLVVKRPTEREEKVFSY